MNDASFSARFFDGKTAQALAVNVEFSDTGVRLLNSEGLLLAEWPLDSILRDTESFQFVLKSDTAPHARLVFRKEDTNALKQISALKKNFQKQKKKSVSWTLKFVLTTLIIIPPFLFASFSLLKALPADFFNFFFKHVKYDEMGFKTCELNQNQQNALNKMRTRIQFEPDTTQIIVIDSAVANAYVLPNKNIYLTSTLFNDVDSAEELAGIISHEIGHIENKDLNTAVFSHFFIQMFFSSSSAERIASLTNNIYSRSAELEADKLAAKRLHESHISVAGLKNFFSDQKGYESWFTNVFSTHPLNEVRLQYLNSLDESALVTEPILTSEEWDWLKILRYCASTP